MFFHNKAVLLQIGVLIQFSFFGYKEKLTTKLINNKKNIYFGLGLLNGKIETCYIGNQIDLVGSILISRCVSDRVDACSVFYLFFILYYTYISYVICCFMHLKGSKLCTEW